MAGSQQAWLKNLIDNWRFRAAEHRTSALATGYPDRASASSHAAFAAAYDNCATELAAILDPPEDDEKNRPRKQATNG